MKPLSEVEDQDFNEYSDPHNSKGGIESFEKIVKKEEIQTIVDILKSRLPYSAHVYNMAKMSSIFPSIQIFAYNKDLTGNALLILKNNRPDLGQEIAISVPNDFRINASDHIKKALIETSVIDWSDKYVFVAVQRLISPMIVEISTIHKGNGTLTNPNFYFYMSQEDAAALETDTPIGAELRSLDESGTKYLVDNWKFSVLNKTLEYTRNVANEGFSSGIYVDGSPASGIIAKPHGLMGMLFTGKSHRGTGYGQICTKSLIKQLGSRGFVGASCAECKNEASKKFHEKLGMKMIQLCDYIFYLKHGFEAKSDQLN